MQRHAIPPGTDRLPIVSHWIDGSEVSQRTAETFSNVFNPALGRPIRRVPFADVVVVENAVQSAAAAFPAWAATPISHRTRILFRFRELLARNRDAISRVVTEENGKTLSEARAEVDRGLQVVEFACGMPDLAKGEYLPGIAADLDSYSWREPLGVCVGITPFNFPAMVPLWMLPVAIALGNTFVLKPSEKDPGASLWLAALFKEAGLPDGVLNVVHGSRVTVEALVDAPAVAAVSVVGSTPVAQSIYQRCSVQGKRAQCLGGAKNHLAVLPDADVDGACTALHGSAFGCAGERCMAVSVAVAVGSVGDDLVKGLVDGARRLSVGPGDNEGTDIGPLVTEEHRANVLRYIQIGIEEGAELVADGRSYTGGVPRRGFFLGPSIFDHVTDGMRLYRDEIFGPVLSVVRVDTLDDAIALINSHAYGNGASVFTSSGRLARQFSARVQAGMVGVNVPVPAPTAYFGFGGFKSSLFGPLHMHGNDGMRFFTRLKTITARWPGERETANAPTGF